MKNLQKNLHKNLPKNTHKNSHKNVHYSLKICVNYTNCGFFSVEIIKILNNFNVEYII